MTDFNLGMHVFEIYIKYMIGDINEKFYCLKGDCMINGIITRDEEITAENIIGLVEDSIKQGYYIERQDMLRVPEGPIKMPGSNDVVGPVSIEEFMSFYKNYNERKRSQKIPNISYFRKK